MYNTFLQSSFNHLKKVIIMNYSQLFTTLNKNNNINNIDTEELVNAWFADQKQDQAFKDLQEIMFLVDSLSSSGQMTLDQIISKIKESK